MKDSICEICLREDPLTVIDMACLSSNGVFKPKCGLRDQPVWAPLNQQVFNQHANDYRANQINGQTSHLNSGISGVFLQVLEFAKRFGISSPHIWKVATVIGTLLGGAGGVWYQTPTQNTGGVEAQKIIHQLSLAQTCLDSGELKCASLMAEPILQANPENKAAKRIVNDVETRKANAPDLDNAGTLQSLASANLDYARECQLKQNTECAVKLALIVLQSIPVNNPAGRQLRKEASSILNQAFPATDGARTR